jgi:hypothetical protein
VPGCGSEASPCGTIQYAVDQASLDDTILVAAGTYTASTACLGVEAVVCVINKEVTILGGYTPGNWSTADPGTNLTIIDGQHVRQGVKVQRTSPSDPFTNLHMEGFTIRNGFRQGASSGGDQSTFAFGGGMEACCCQVTLKDMVFRNNQVIGGNTNSSYGGAGSGGGLALGGMDGVTLEGILFDQNEARGGTGSQRGGYAIGGGLYTYDSVVSGAYLTFTNNMAIAGDSPGSGDLNGARADAQGAAIGIQVSSDITLQYVTATDNTAVGGNAVSYGGGAWGGAVAAELATFTLRDAELQGNVALGGNGAEGGLGCGGALQTSRTEMTVDRVRMIDNRATGGDGTTERGSAGGGGAYLTGYGDGTQVQIANSVIADNLAETGATGQVAGGGGGGLWLQGVEAEITHTTFARNRLGSAPMSGLGLIVVNYGCPTATTVDISYSIFADHTSHAGTSALWVGEPNSATLRRTLWSGNVKDTNAGESGAGTIVDIDPIWASSPGFVAPGAPSYDYHLGWSSLAIDQAQGSTLSVDMDGDARPANGSSDIGADEYTPPALFLLPPFGVNETLELEWEANLSLMAELDHFEVTVFCEPGARPPDQGPCDAPFSVGQQSEFVLTGLSNDRTYGATVEARDTTGELLAASNTATGVPRDYAFRAFIPLIAR